MYNKQRMNKLSPSRVLTSCVAWKPKMHDDVMLNGIIQSLLMVCYQATADAKPIERKIYYQSELALNLFPISLSYP